MFRKILKWTALVLVLLLSGIAVATMFRQHLTYEAPYPNVKTSTDLAMIEKGKHIVMVEKACV
ncbi:hypothetical protein [Rufibacter tibetensis]|uniref:Uncharacterized protein n=1 Tax=Rufibacter tibetensis TaxID=512763 RepID=A0A0P0CTW2_9BACT|nr:hypothetical protein [Rufibacter tibetensis]ALI98681.1 hypothetical protein DC20_06495 [Rufibacter tibetensis]